MVSKNSQEKQQLSKIFQEHNTSMTHENVKTIQRRWIINELETR